MNTEPIEQPTITFLNSTGDVTITWSKEEEPAMLALIETKMAAGFSFFILKPRLDGVFGGLLGCAKVPVKSIDDVRQAQNVVADNKTAKGLVFNLGDEDISAVVASVKVTLLSTARSASLDTVKRATSATEVVSNQTVAIKAIVGG